MRVNQVSTPEIHVIVTAVDLAHGADRSDSRQKMATDSELQSSAANRARQQHVNNRFIVVKEAQGQRHNYMGGCVFIHSVFNVSLFAVHFSLPTKS